MYVVPCDLLCHFDIPTLWHEFPREKCADTYTLSHSNAWDMIRSSDSEFCESVNHILIVLQAGDCRDSSFCCSERKGERAGDNAQ